MEGKTLLNRIGTVIISGLLIFVGIWFLSTFIASGLEHGQITFDIYMITNSTTIGITAVLFMLVIIYYLTSFTDERRRYREADSKTDGMQKYYDTHWMTKKALRRNALYKYHTFEQLKNSTNIGIPIRAEYRGGKIHINMYKSIHTLVIGTTGSGKTTQYVDPMIQILGESKAKPCMVITDPKGELYDNHSEKLRKAGYRIIVFDLKDPYQSTRWNPLSRPYDLYHRALNLEKEVLVHRGDKPTQYKNLKLAGNNFGQEWYELNKHAFDNVNELKTYMKSMRQILKTDALEELSDLAEVLSPVESTTDPTWERGAKEFLQGTLMAMLEDSEDPRIGMTRDKFNFYNLAKIVNFRDPESNMYRTLTEYFQGRDKLSAAVQLTNQVLTNAPNTKSSYMGMVTERVRMFNDLGVAYATSGNEMELSGFANEPTALFIKIPDERITRHSIATMFISQLYKTLVSAADQHGGVLPREVHFVLDEFANMPPIVNFETIITVARGRRIFFTLILQSYAQLSIKYKEDVAKTVKDNCNIHVFIASNDMSTKEEFSKRCGNISVKTRSTSVSQGEKDLNTNKSYSVTVDSRPLIYPEELGALRDEMIVSILKQPPLKAVFTPSYYKSARKFYSMDKAPDVYIVPGILDENAVYYDIKKRNSAILGAGSDDDFDIFG